MRELRSDALKELRDLILVGNMMAYKLGKEPTNLADTWDEMVIRLRNSGVLQHVAMADLTVERVDAQYRAALAK